MSKPVMGLGIAFVLMGLWIAAFPGQLLSTIDWESRSGLLVAAGIRVVSGLILVVAAPTTRYPVGLRIFGGLVLVVGLSLPFLPIDLWASLMRWWLFESQGFYRVASALGGVVLGGFLIHAARPE